MRNLSLSLMLLIPLSTAATPVCGTLTHLGADTWEVTHASDSGNITGIDLNLCGASGHTSNSFNPAGCENGGSPTCSWNFTVTDSNNFFSCSLVKDADVPSGFQCVYTPAGLPVELQVFGVE